MLGGPEAYHDKPQAEQRITDPSWYGKKVLFISARHSDFFLLQAMFTVIFVGFLSTSCQWLR
jgi:hypothetical protein